MRWERLGRVVDGFSYCPTVVPGDPLRILYAEVGEDQVGRVTSLDLDPADPTQVLHRADSLALDVGGPGSFDEHGVTPLSCIELGGGRLRLYYAGWQRGRGRRYRLFTGAAESGDGGLTFERLTNAPVLPPVPGEESTRSSCHVRRDDDSFRMWYAGGSEWVGEADAAKPRYALCYLESSDGVAWPSSSEVVLQPEPDELGFSRPSILAGGDVLRMWYSLRRLDGYTLGYAESPDGRRWKRLDHCAGLDLGGPGAWDSEMVGLTDVAETAAGTYLFYNGNGYGRTGFGVAVLTP